MFYLVGYAIRQHEYKHRLLAPESREARVRVIAPNQKDSDCPFAPRTLRRQEGWVAGMIFLEVYIGIDKRW